MDFTFTVRVATISRLMTVEVSVEGEAVGVLRLQEDEWDSLQPMLVHGDSFFMDDEAHIVIKEAHSTLPAYLEGTNG